MAIPGEVFRQIENVTGAWKEGRLLLVFRAKDVPLSDMDLLSEALTAQKKYDVLATKHPARLEGWYAALKLLPQHRWKKCHTENFWVWYAKRKEGV